jgi:protein subunit release factor B
MTADPPETSAAGEDRSAPIVLPENDDDLLAACEMEVFRGTGPGGQHRNTSNTGVRLRHRDTGLVVACQEERSQYRNRRRCLHKLRALAARLNHRPRRRLPTRMPRSARERILRQKAHISARKQRRQRPGNDE